MGGKPKPGGKPDKRLGGNAGGKTGKTVKSGRAGK
jgi:hypothetical protein